MKPLLSALFILCLISTSSGCFRNDTRVETFNVPMMKGEECLSVLSGKLRGIEGVKDVQADFESGVVTVTFDGLKLGYKNIEFVIAGSGFDCNDTPASASAKATLPASCR